MLTIKESTYLAIGYSLDEIDLMPDIDGRLTDELTGLIADLAALKTQLQQNLVESSSVQKLDGISLDVRQGRRDLKAEGSRILKVIANRLGVEVKQDEFARVINLSVYRPQ